MYKKITFPNGLRLIVSPSKNTEAITVQVMAGAGSRYETREMNGLAHFLEHMFFKGAKKYKKAKDVSEAIDSVGGEFNAFTGKEYVGYYVKTAKQHAALTISVLSDMLLHSKLDAKEIERERGVILEEINMYEDNPMAKVGEEFEQLMYGDQPLGWKIAGPKDVIRTLGRVDFVKYQQTFYTPDNIVIAVAGNCSVDAITKMIKKSFTFSKRTKSAVYAPFVTPTVSSRVRLVHRPTEQAHLLIGTPGLHARDPRRFAGQVLASILGGGMSSRMFISVREQQGLCYYISSSLDLYLDAGHFETRAGVDLQRVDQAVTAILAEYKKICTGTITPKELKKAKEYMKGQATLRMEASDEVADFLGRQELLHNKIDELPALFKKIDAVTAADVRSVARSFFQNDLLRFALIGPYSDEKHFDHLLKL